MGLTNIYITVGQKVEKYEVIGDMSDEEFDDDTWIVDPDGKLATIDFFDSRRILKKGDQANTILVLDYAPYKAALGEEVILGVEIEYGIGDGYANITSLFTSEAQMQDMVQSVTELLRARGLPHNKVGVWVVAVPDI